MVTIYENEKLLLACLERIFICIGIVAIVLGSIISIWTQIDKDFQNFHKLASTGHDYKRVPSKHVKTKNVKCQILRTTNATSLNNTSKQNEGSISDEIFV